MAATKGAERGRGKLAGALAYMVVGFMATAFLSYPVHYLKWDENLTYELGSAAIMVVGVCLLGGARMLRPSRRALRDVWHLGWPVIAISAALCAMQVVSYASDGTAPSAHWAQGVGYYALLCLGIGAYEECYLRGILLNGLLARLGRTRWGVGLSIAVAALFFGSLHIDWAGLDYGSALELAQAALKVAQTAIYAVILSAAVMRDRNLSGAALFHALDDFLVMVVPYGIFGEGLEVSYVSSGQAEARSSIFMYAVLIVLYLPSLRLAVRSLRGMGLPQRGGFVTEGQVGEVPPEGVPLVPHDVPAKAPQPFSPAKECAAQSQGARHLASSGEGAARVPGAPRRPW